MNNFSSKNYLLSNLECLSSHPNYLDVSRHSVLPTRKHHDKEVRSVSKIPSYKIFVFPKFHRKHSISAKWSQIRSCREMAFNQASDAFHRHLFLSTQNSVLSKVSNPNTYFMSLCFSRVFYSGAHLCRNEKANKKALVHPQEPNFQTQHWIVGRETVISVSKLKWEWVDLWVGGPHLPLSFFPKLSLVSMRKN